MMTDKRRRYTAEFNRAAVRLVTAHGYAVAEAAHTLGRNAHRRRRWTCAVEQTQHGAFPGHGRVSRDPAALQRWRDDHQRRRLERDILTNALGVFASASRCETS
jgi:transposase-like protein